MKAMLLSWNWRIDVIVLLLAATTLFTRGWWRLRLQQKANGHFGRLSASRLPKLATGWRLAAYLGGLACILLALLSPIDVLGGMLFTMHMVQHLLLVMLAPPLLLIANPLPFLLWGMPQAGRKIVSGWLKKESPFRQGLRKTTTPPIVWMAFIVIYLGWHDPNAYNTALQIEWVHDLEHLTFFISAMLYWWHVTAAGPRIHKRFSPGRRIAFLVAVVPINMLIGMGITFAREPIYTYYTAVPRLWELTAVQDQMVGGIIMWVPGSMMFLIAALILISRLFQTNVQGSRENIKTIVNGQLSMVNGSLVDN
ncbi:MAG: cytochrome c oxidase assembly protein [Chloroflexi bacterium]|nr:cytochrome c oxidase assembly protein [Chloroflexota bacterium]